MKLKNKGFTLIELIIVIILLGILAVVAVPQYINLSTNAQTAATSGVAAALSSANTINYGARSSNPATGIAIANCTDLASALQGGALPNGYSITAAPVAVNQTVLCTLNGPSASTALFSATGIN